MERVEGKSSKSITRFSADRLKQPANAAIVAAEGRRRSEIARRPYNPAGFWHNTLLGLLHKGPMLLKNSSAMAPPFRQGDSKCLPCRLRLLMGSLIASFFLGDAAHAQRAVFFNSIGSFVKRPKNSCRQSQVAVSRRSRHIG
jgi:hypothetical protein